MLKGVCPSMCENARYLARGDGTFNLMEQMRYFYHAQNYNYRYIEENPLTCLSFKKKIPHCWVFQ